MAFTSEGVGGAVIVGLTSTPGDLNVTGDITLDGTVDGIDIATDVAANTAKNTNVPTSLTITGDTGARTIVSDGTDVVIPVATDSVSGVMSAADHAILAGIEVLATADQTGIEIIGLLNSDLGGHVQIGNQASDTLTVGGPLTVSGDLVTLNTVGTIGKHPTYATKLNIYSTGGDLYLGANPSGTLANWVWMYKGIILGLAGSGDADLLIKSNNGNNAGDEWKVRAERTTQKFCIGNDIASAGTYVDLLTITPHATAASSTVNFAGSIVAGGSIVASGSVFASADGYLSTSSEIRHTTITAITLDEDIKATFAGYIVEGRTVIKVPATAFIANDDVMGATYHAAAAFEDDGSNFGIRAANSGLELFAYVDVPLGYTATKVKITGSDTANEVEVYTLDLDDGTIGSEISNSGLTVADDTVLASNHVGADDKMLLIKIVTTNTNDVVYGGYVTIQAT